MKKLSKQITLGYDPMTGKRIRKRIYADSKTGLQQAEKDLITEFAKNGSPSSITYKDYEDKWFEANCSKLAPRTQVSYRSTLKKADKLLNMQMSKIIRPDLQALVNEQWNHPYTCQRLAGMLSSIWKSAVFDGVVDKNIATGLKMPKRTKAKRRPLTDAELKAIKKADFTEKERFMVNILLQFGLRPGEAFALDRQSFNRKARTLTINKNLSYDGEKPFIKSTKTGVTRILPVPDSFWKKIPKINTLAYFAHEDGRYFTKTESYDFGKRIVRKINEAMGGNNKIQATDMTLYYFRHHKASLLYYLPGISMKKKAEYMGHSEEMFLKTYSHMMEAKEDVEVLRQAVI